MWTTLARLSFAALLVLVGREAGAAEDIDLELVGKALVGQGQPALVLRVNKSVSTLRVELTREGGDKVVRSLGPIAKGKDARIELPVPVGSWRFSGTLAAKFADGKSGEMPLSFEVAMLEPLRVEVVERDVATGLYTLRLTRAAAHCAHETYVDGMPMQPGRTRFSGEAAGTPLRVKLPVGPGEVLLKVRLTCYDTEGAYNGVEDTPWFLEVPHEEVIFPSGESRIDDAEAPKLERAYADIATAVRRYGKVVAIRLFVIGHTDTVGDAAHNLELSWARARAIAAYFKQKGVSVPVSYAGMGEGDLAVPTADNTDEARNRRAQYVLAVDPPRRLDWRGL